MTALAMSPGLFLCLCERRHHPRRQDNGCTVRTGSRFTVVSLGIRNRQYCRTTRTSKAQGRQGAYVNAIGGHAASFCVIPSLITGHGPSRSRRARRYRDRFRPRRFRVRGIASSGWRRTGGPRRILHRGFPQLGGGGRGRVDNGQPLLKPNPSLSKRAEPRNRRKSVVHIFNKYL